MRYNLSLFLLPALLFISSPAFAETGDACLAADPDAHAKCIATTGAVRSLMSDLSNGDMACQQASRDDMAMINSVIDWIKARPERHGDDLANLAREALMELDPCAQRSLIPQLNPNDPVDTE